MRYWNPFLYSSSTSMKPTSFYRAITTFELLKLSHSIPIFFTRVSGLFEFSTPTYFIRDPKLLKKLTVKDFDSFLDHKSFLGEDVDPLFGKALFSLQGQKWKGVWSLSWSILKIDFFFFSLLDMRATLSPAFTGEFFLFDFFISAL